jgi:hypothetical protein
MEPSFAEAVSNGHHVIRRTGEGVRAFGYGDESCPPTSGAKFDE